MPDGSDTPRDPDPRKPRQEADAQEPQPAPRRAAPPHLPPGAMGDWATL